MSRYKVTVYTQPSCQPCRFTKRKFNEAGIEYEERDAVAKENHTYVRQLGHQQAPVVTVHRDNALWLNWSGLNPDMIRVTIDALEQEAAA